ncbi:hypothetical protein [Nonomuraea gerenzanensis]|uniref:LPXTG-motif cell wall anchor domain protein n=1 Tax=Nonomuraea gerenzanensis TaxID=93944 RepID=A0A1M4E0I0_9ACTN|nr:hypothetical protein [Nonomuraea gerenzanensis]UBU14594.1 hypothetical protein LCN96_06085 [Nonomuraea gerenzanensis]SBO92311.1 LPXTG-motif cell wall anchor domain protein [Nonomuraea gerenzanensis]
MAERTVDIRDPSRRPTAGAVTASREQIQQWLDGTSPMEVHDRGMTYGRVAEAVKAVADALPDIGVALNDAWRSEAAAKTQRALQMLHASGTELADAMTKMSQALTLYGRDYLPTAIEDVRAAASTGQSDAEPRPSPGPAPTASASAEPTTEPTIGTEPTPGPTPHASELDDQAARRAMETLNRQIVDLYDFQIPASVTIDLPTVTPATDPGGRDLPSGDQERPYTFGDSGGGGGSSGGSSGWDSVGNSGGSTGSTGSSGSSGSPGSSGSSGGSDGSSGSGSGSGSGDRPGTETPGSSDGSGSDTPGSSDGSAGSPGDQGSSPAGSQGDGGDGTTPSVIDSSTTDPERTTQTGAETHDPRATETAGTQPAPTATTTPTTTYTPATTPQTSYLTPTGSAAPAVIGGSGSYTQPGVPGAAAAARAGAGGMGYPFMPMGGGAPAGEQEQHEQGTNLTGERDDWHSATESTISPVIRN